MKYAVVFDCHLWNHKRFGGPLKQGINRRGQLTLQTLRLAVDGANAECAPLIVAGDLVDEAGPIWPQFAAAIRAELYRATHGVYLLLGNHDMTADNDHSLHIYESDSVRVVDSITRIGSSLTLVPFNADFTHEFVETPVVIGHFGVFDDSFPAFMKKSHEAWHVARLFAFMRERSIRCALLGDWHTRYLWSLADSVPSAVLPAGAQHRWSRDYSPSENLTSSVHFFHDRSLVLQGGCLNPTGFDNKGLYGFGTLAIVDTDTKALSWCELPGPRFCTVHDRAEELTLISKMDRHQLFIRRYYEGTKPEQPSGVEAYEALPIALQQKAKLILGVDPVSTNGRLEALISEWLGEMRAIHGDSDSHEKLLKRYL